MSTSRKRARLIVFTILMFVIPCPFLVHWQGNNLIPPNIRVIMWVHIVFLFLKYVHGIITLAYVAIEKNQEKRGINDDTLLTKASSVLKFGWICYMGETLSTLLAFVLLALPPAIEQTHGDFPVNAYANLIAFFGGF